MGCVEHQENWDQWVSRDSRASKGSLDLQEREVIRETLDHAV